MTYGIWMERKATKSIEGVAAWMIRNGKPETYDTLAEAERVAAYWNSKCTRFTVRQINESI